MGCGISRSVQVVSSAHLQPAVVDRSDQYITNQEKVEERGHFNSSLNQSKSQTSLWKTSLGLNLTKSQTSLQAEVSTSSSSEDEEKQQECRKTRFSAELTTTKKVSTNSSLSSLEEAAETRSCWDSRSVVTSRTVLTTHSAVSGRTKSTYLERSNYDVNTLEEVTTPSPKEQMGFHGNQRKLEVLQKIPMRPPVVYGGNHFWWPSKRMLFSDYRQVKELDKIVDEVSVSSDPAQLVSDLTRPCEEEVEVARAIFRWISTNIAYRPCSTNYAHNNNSPVQIMKQRRGSAKDFSILYQYLCSLANLECEVLGGLCKRVNFYPGLYSPEEMCKVNSPMYHYWNKIRLSRRWYLVDVSLSQQGCKTDHMHAPSSTFSEEMFLPRPSDLVSTHLPTSSDGDVLAWDVDNQLLGDSPTVDIEEWAQAVVRATAASEWGIKPLSHQRGVIETDESEVWLQFMCPNIMDYHVHLESAEKGVEYFGYSLLYLQEDIVTAYLRLPGPGVYIARLYAAPCYVKPGTEGLGCKLAMMYTIHAAGTVVHLPFSTTFDGLWGMTPQLFDTGCRVLSTKGAEVTAIDGRLCLDFRLPVEAIFPNLVWFCKAREEDKNLDGFVYAEREGRLARIHLLCPDPGEYILLFQMPIEGTTIGRESGEQLAYARFFITCQSPATTSEGTPSFPHFEHCLCGPLESIASYGLWLPEQLGSTLYAKQGTCQFLLRQERPVNIIHDIEGEGGTKHREAGRWIFSERNGYDVTYNIRVSEPGRYRITLSAGEYDTSEMEIVVVLMFDTCDAFTGDLYPPCETIWGVEPLFHELGLCSDMEEKSQLPIHKGQAELSIRAPNGVTLLPKLYHANDKSMDMAEHRVVCREGQTLTFYVTLPFKGFYRLKITHEDHQVASYLLACDIPAKPCVPYEQFCNIYGLTDIFHSHGLKDLTEKEKPIRVAEKCRCIIRHSVPKGFPMHFCLVRDNREISSCIYAERLSGEVAYHIELKKVGYYRFTCWSRFEDSKMDGLLFSYLLFCPEEEEDFEASLGAYPELSEVWGLNMHGFMYGVSVRSQHTSTIRAIEGRASLVLSHTDDVVVTYTLEHQDLTIQEAKRCLFLEHQATSLRHLSVSLPYPGRYALKLLARKDLEESSQQIGVFLVVSSDAVSGSESFPVFSDFYQGCRLVEPRFNPLSAKTEHFFQIEVPGAKRLQLWDGTGRWSALLEPQEGSDVISGMVDVGEPKELWLAGMYDPEFAHSNGGFRNLLMYEVV